MTHYGYTFLTKPRWTSSDEDAVERSHAQWREVDHDPRAGIEPGSGPWSLSLLGVINGRFMLGLCLVAKMNDDGEILGYSLKKRWW